MCSSKATLFYGLFVTSSSLTFAATAHQATKAPFLAIDLILFRRRSGKLEIEKQEEKTTARDLSAEVWTLVKGELVEMEIEAADRAAVDELRCSWCAGPPVVLEEGEEIWPSLPGGAGSNYEWKRWGEPMGYCEVCDVDIFNSHIHQRKPEQKQAVATLLQEYELTTPSDEVWSVNEYQDDDFNCLSAISLPLATRNNSSNVFPSAATESPSGVWSPKSSVLAFSPPSFLVPADANRRFARLVSDWRLQLVEFAKPTITTHLCARHSNNTMDAQAEQKDTAGKQGLAEKPSPKRVGAPVDPKWLLWNHCYGW